LSPEQRELLLQYLAQGPRAHGFSAENWTQTRVAALIRKKFGIKFCAFHVGRILAAHGWEFHKADQKMLGWNGKFR
jgi:transposase